MMRSLLQQGSRISNKKGVSLMIGYVLLVVMAITLSVLVFAFLKLYLPKNEPKCYEDVVLSIDEVTCQNGKLELTLTNRGLFDINGAFIRIGERGRIYKQAINDNPEVLFLEAGEDNVLTPGETWHSLSYDYPGLDVQELEVEPLLFIDDKPALCEKAVVSKDVVCITTPLAPESLGALEDESANNKEQSQG